MGARLVVGDDSTAGEVDEECFCGATLETGYQGFEGGFVIGVSAV